LLSEEGDTLDIVYWLVSPTNAVFVIALGIASGLALLEVAAGGLSEMVDLDVDVDGPESPGALLVGLGWLGFGKAPVSVLLATLLGSFALAGLIVMAIARDAAPAMAPILVLPVGLGVGAVAGVFTTRVVGEVIHRLVPNNATTVRGAGFYVGQSGRAMGLINADVGQVQVRNDGDSPVLLRVVSAHTLNSGTPVVLVSYDADRKLYRVEPETEIFPQ
jgi:hypothetical protein